MGLTYANSIDCVLAEITHSTSFSSKGKGGSEKRAKRYSISASLRASSFDSSRSSLLGGSGLETPDGILFPLLRSSHSSFSAMHRKELVHLF